MLARNALTMVLAATLAALVLLTPRAALAQNPVQWSTNAGRAIERAREQLLPILIWVKDGRNDGGGNGDNDLEDAQEDCFRDPVVVGIIQKHFVPLKVSRNSRSVEEMKRLGLPTGFGLYCAVLTYDGNVLDTMGPGEVAQPHTFATHLNTAYTRFCGDVYQKEIKPVLEDLKSPKSKARLAAQAVWRLGIKQADTVVIGLLSREDLSAMEKSRVYELLASLSTAKSIGALLERADDKQASAALAKANPGALEWLLPAMPSAEGEISARQLAAYTAAAKICRTSPKGKDWWDNAKPEARQKELDRVGMQAATVLEFWRQQEGMEER